jgi:NAD+--dinitrogen-reductase ADP-D-ribosyltransferase
MNEYRQNPDENPSLPAHARLSVNRCNLPAVILGSLTFQRNPTALYLDCVEEFNSELFETLDTIDDATERAENFKGYMRSAFLFDHLEEAGFDPNTRRSKRDKADYLRMLRGWLFDPDGKEGAVLKSWVESRFGLLPRNHQGPLGDYSSDNYQAYLAARAQGLYNTNGLEAQFDLLFSYCQYEVRRQFPDQRHITLYRGVNRIDEHEVLAQPEKRRYILVLNNLNSFTDDRERADEFGDYILEAQIPLAKLVFMPGLLPDLLKGENEYLVIGGVCEVKLSLM